MDKLTEMQNLIAEAVADGTAFYDKGNKAAGTRVRAAMQQLKGLAQSVRADVQERKNAAKEVK